MHVGMGADPEGLISYCNGNDIVVQAYSPLAHGEVVTDRLCKKIGSSYNRTAAEVGLRWVLQQGQKQTAIVVKSDKLSSMEEDLQSLSWKLKQNDVEMLDKANTPKGSKMDGQVGAVQNREETCTLRIGFHAFKKWCATWFVMV